MIVIYYSHTGQTEKFVNKFFVDALKERFHSVTTIRVQADGPHTSITCKEINGTPVPMTSLSSLTPLSRSSSSPRPMAVSTTSKVGLWTTLP